MATEPTTGADDRAETTYLGDPPPAFADELARLRAELDAVTAERDAARAASGQEQTPGEDEPDPDRYGLVLACMHVVQSPNLIATEHHCDPCGQVRAVFSSYPLTSEGSAVNA